MRGTRRYDAPRIWGPRIRPNLWRIFWGAPRILIRGAPKHGAPQIMGPMDNGFPSSEKLVAIV
jgi:hypothetical protein